jgi:hypothetical protein
MYGKWEHRGLNGFGFTDGFGYEACLDWVIVGGESGPNFRSMQKEWAESLRKQCEDADVDFFFKQDSDPKPGQRADLLGRVIQQTPMLASYDFTDAPFMTGPLTIDKMVELKQMVKEDARRRKWWIIEVTGYGDFSFFGTEAEAEDTRIHKAEWEGGEGMKRRADRDNGRDRKLIAASLKHFRWEHRNEVKLEANELEAIREA